MLHYFNVCYILLAERYIPGVGRGVSNTDALKREIIHRLYIAPQSHSELVKQFRVSLLGTLVL